MGSLHRPRGRASLFECRSQQRFEQLENRVLLSTTFSADATTFAGSVPASAPSFADLDRDGDLDIVWSAGRSLYTVENLGHRAFGSPREYRIMGIIGALAVGDVDGDHVPDIVADGRSAAGTYRLLRVFLGRGDGTLARPESKVIPWPESGSASVLPFMRTGNLDSDRAAEILVNAPGNDVPGETLAVYDFASNRPAFTRYLNNSTSNAVIADLNGDGLDDVVSPTLAWLGTPGGRVDSVPTPVTIAGSGAPWSIVGVVRSGSPPSSSLVLQGGQDPGHTNYSVLAIASNATGLAFGEPSVIDHELVSQTTNSWSLVGNTDINGDGIADLLFENHASISREDLEQSTGSLLQVLSASDEGTASIVRRDEYRETGYSNSVPPVDFGTPHTGYSAVDLDGDQRPDLASAGIVRWSTQTQQRPVFEEILYSPPRAGFVSQLGLLSLLQPFDADAVRGGSVVKGEFWGDSNHNGRLDAADILIGTDTDPSDGFSTAVLPDQPWAANPTLVFARVQDDTGRFSRVQRIEYTNPNPTIGAITIEGHSTGRVRVGEDISFLVTGVRPPPTSKRVQNGVLARVFLDLDGSGTFTSGDIELGTAGRVLGAPLSTRRLTVRVSAAWGVGRTVQVIAFAYTTSSLPSRQPATLLMTVFPAA